MAAPASPASTDNSAGDGKDTAATYLDAIDRYDRGTEDWRKQAETVNKIYLDQHRTNASPRRFALLWSNIETLKPAVYARTPVAVVSRRFKDADAIGRQAGEILERCINTQFDLYGANEVLELVRDDRLLAARGAAWVRYEAQFDESGSQADEGQPQGQGKLAGEHICLDYVHWADFGHNLFRTWPEVTIVWRRVYLTREKVEKRFGQKLADKLTYAVRPEFAQRYGPTIQDATEPQAVIYEIWDKAKKQACWLAKEEKIILDSGEPPLKFRNFFPCPKPCYGTHSSGSLIPVPDYRFYQDQAEEINDLTEKIASLQEWLVLKAFIPSGPSSEGSDAIISMLQALTDKLSDKGIFVPVESWAGFQDKGGSRMIDWLPMDMVIQTIDVAIKARQQLIQDVYQITGISDILRGETDPNETLGAQQIKAQTGSRRIQTTQRDLARFARDLAEMVGEVIADCFQPETMAAMSGFDLTVDAKPFVTQLQMLQARLQPPPAAVAPPAPAMAAPGAGAAPPSSALAPAPAPDPQLLQQAQQLQQRIQQVQQNAQVLQLLRDEKTRNFRIDIETDSTIEPDETAEKQRRVEFVEAVGQFLTQAMPVLQLARPLAPMVGEMLLFLVRGFRAGRQMEESIEEAVKAIGTQEQQPPPPDPRIAAIQAEMQSKMEAHQASMQQADQEHQQKLQQIEAEGQVKLGHAQLQTQQMVLKHQAEMQSLTAQHQVAMEQAGVEAGRNAQQHEMTLEQGRAKAQQQKQAKASIEVKHGADEITGPLSDAIAKFGEHLANSHAQSSAAQAQQMEILQALLRQAAAPRRLVRDNKGRASHSEMMQ